MNSAWHKVFWWMILLAFFLAGNACKTPRQVMKAPIKEEGADYLFKKLKENEFIFNDLSMRFSASFSEGKGRKTSFSGQIRISHDSVIWISISPMLGIEAFRLMLSQDSVFILNRLEKSYFREDFSYLNQMISSTLDFDMLEAFLLGNDFSWFDNTRFKASLDGTDYKLSTTQRRKLKRTGGNNQAFPTIPIQDIWLEPETFKISKVVIREADAHGRIIHAEYMNFIDTGSRRLPGTINIRTEGDKNVNIALEYSKVVMNEGIDFPFKIPPGYIVLPR